MAAAPQQKFEAAVNRVCELSATANAMTDHVNEAWTALRTGIVAARKLADVLDSCPEERMHHSLVFVLERGVQKRAARGQVRECLRILLARPPWLAFARADGVRGRVVEALDGEHDAELISEVLAQEVAEEAEAEDSAAEEPAAGEVLEGAAQAESPRPAEEPAEEPTASPKHVAIRERLARGKAILESFGWEFPRDPTGTRGDEATAGFQLILDAVTALTTTSGRASVGDEPLAAMVDLEQDWQGLLQFLVSMHGSGVRKTYSARIRFVTVTLRALAPAFRELVPWASLPWGHLPMPTEEAEAEARVAEVEVRVAEEIRRRKAEEAENLVLAQELQAQEDAQALVLDEVQRHLIEEDLALARKLQEQGQAGGAAARKRIVQLPRILRRRSAGGA